MKTKLNFLLSILFLIGTVLPVFAVFPGNCLNFELYDYISGAGIPTSFSPNGVTIEGWVNHSSLSANIQRYFTAFNENLVLRKENNSIDFYVKSSSGAIYHALSPTGYLAVNQWVHVAGTYDGNTARLYVNGNQVASVVTSGGFYSNTGDFIISESGNESMRGKIDDVRLWNVVRTKQQIEANRFRELTGLETGLRSYWKFNASSGTTATDTCGNSHGTLLNMTNANWVASTIPLSMNFSGTISTNTTWAAPTVNITGDVTIAPSATLTIAPGVKVNFQGAYKMSVEGGLLAEGTTQDSIRFTSPTAIYWKGIRFVSNAIGSSISQCLIENVHADGTNTYGAFTLNNANLAISHTRFLNNYSPTGGTVATNGGAAINSVNSAVVVSHCTFENNNSAALMGGGAIFANQISGTYGGHLTLESCKLINNTANHGGGAIRASDAMIINNCVFRGNTSYSFGSAISIMDSLITNPVNYSVTITNSIFDSNDAYTSNGRGTISITNNAGCNVTNSTMINNDSYLAEDVWVNCSNPALSSRIFRNCIFWGEDVYSRIGVYASTYFYNCDIKAALENPYFLASSCFADDPFITYAATNPGTGYVMDSLSPCINAGDPTTNLVGMPTDINGNARVYNYTWADGSLATGLSRIDVGAIEVQNPGAFLIDGAVINTNHDIPVDLYVRKNYTANISAGVTLAFAVGKQFVTKGNLIAEGTHNNRITFTEMTPGTGWGGLSFDGTSSTPNTNSSLNYCIVENGTTNGEGGNISANNYSTLQLQNCHIRDGQATNGGGLSNNNSSVKLTNCLLNNNTATQGGALHINNSASTELTNCTVAENVSSDGGAIYASNLNTQPLIRNCIFWGNGSSPIAGSSLTDVRYCNVEGSYTGTGNINRNPLFSGEEGNPYNLSNMSYCINTGTTGLALPATDLQGNARIYAHIPVHESYNRVDMGAYEYQGYLAPSNFSASDGNNNYPGYVQLLWDFNSNYNIQPQNFRILRNGTSLTVLDGQTHSYSDYNVVPGTIYIYQVQADYGFAIITNSQEDGGYIKPNGIISGHIKTPNNNPVTGVKISLTPSTGNCLQLNSSNSSSINITNPQANMNQNFTLETWVKTTGQDLILLNTGSHNLAINAAGLVQYNDGINTLTQQDTLVNVHDGDWHHIALVNNFTDSRVFMYLDYVKAAGDTTYIFSNYTPSDLTVPVGFTGFIDDIRLWAIARDSSDVVDAMNIVVPYDSPGLHGSWSMNEGTGMNIYDATNNSHNGVLTNCTWSSDDPDIALGAITDAWGDYVITQVSYGSATTFTVTPSKPGHMFQPEQRMVTLSTSNIAANNVDFTDNSMIPISGYVKYLGTNIPVVNANIWLNGVQALPPVLTNADGYYVMEVEHGTSCVVSANYNNHTFNREWNLGTVTIPWSFINFNDTFTTMLCVEVVGGDDSYPIGDFDVTIASVSYSFARSDTSHTWPNGYINIFNLPPLNYNVTVNPDSYDPFNLFYDVQFQNNKTQNIDLTYSDALGDTIRFVWRAPLQIDVAWPDSLQLTHFADTVTYPDSFYVLTQNELYSVDVQAYEDYSYAGHLNQKTYLDDCDITINDLIGIKGRTTGTFADTTVYVYSFAPYLPNIQSGYPRQYQKMIEFTVKDKALNRTVTKSDWALTQGVKPLESTFATTSPEIPFLILHDPPGDGSFASFTSGSSISQSISTSVCTDKTNNIFTNIHLGPDITVEAGTGFFNTETELDFTADLDYGLTLEKKQHNSKEQTYIFTTSETYSTSNSDDIIGDGADVFVGGALNLIWGITKEVSWDNLNSTVIIDSSCMVTPNGFATVYIYTDSQIRNTVIPNLITIGDSASVVLWQSFLDMNEYNKAHAITNPNHPGNYSFNAGPSYTYNETNTVSAKKTIEFESIVSHEFGVKLGATVDGVGAESGFKFKTEITLGAAGAVTSDSTTTTTFTFADDDITSDLTENSDYFTVDVKSDPQYGTPVFHLISGASSNHWEPNTQPRDGVMMTANTYTASNLPMGSAAAFLLYLSNTSQSNEARRYYLEVMNATNPIGATVKINGAAIVGRMAFDLEAGETTQAVLTVEPGLFGYELEGLTLEFYADGDRGYAGPADHYFDIFRSFDISWEAPYSRVAIHYPQDNWLINQALNDTLDVVLRDYDLTKQDFKSVKLQYKHPESTDWLPAFEVMRAVLESHPYYISIPWDVSSLADGIYQIRAVTTDSIQVDWFTEAITGMIDRSSPVLWGLPQPADGVLQPGDLISLTFTEDIDPNTILPECVSVKILSNQVVVDVNVQVNGSSVSIVPNIANFWLENEIVQVKVEGLKDLYGNPMADSVQWEFFVNANPVAWVQPKIEIIKPMGQSATITTYLNNSGGQFSSFSLNGFPTWLTANVNSGTLLPLDNQEITFTISNQLGYGTFRDTIYADIPALGKEPLIFEVSVLANPPAWATTQLDNFDYSMTITGQLSVDSEISMDTNDIIGAFILDNNGKYICRGYANLQKVPYFTDVYQFYLTINSDNEDGEELYFRVWDFSTSKEHFGLTEEFTFESGAVYGTPLNAMILHVSPELFRSIPCKVGWNWVSVNLLNPSMEVDSLLTTLSPTANDIVKNQTTYAQYVAGIGWVGSLDDISTTEMVKIKLTNADELQLIGNLENPNITSITYGSGWNWIGYLPHVSISVNQALADISNPATGDLIKSQNGYSQYIDGYGWFGSMLFMEAGKGYMLNSTNSGTFNYPDYVFARDEEEPPSTEREDRLRDLTGWDVNPLNYEYSSNITAEIQCNSQLLNNENVMLGAFYNGECRGAAAPVRVLDQWVFFLTQYSNVLNQTFTYKVYLADNDEVVDAAETLPFVNNQILGNPLDPYTFNIVYASLEAPQNIDLDIINNTITLTWDSVAGAATYKVFASGTINGEFTEVTNLGSFTRDQASESAVLITSRKADKVQRDVHSRTRVSWSCSLSGSINKFYYVTASSDSR